MLQCYCVVEIWYKQKTHKEVQQKGNIADQCMKNRTNWPTLFVWKYSMSEVSLRILIIFICLCQFFFFLPKLLEAVTSCLARQEAAGGKEESIIFTYCFLARFRICFSSLAGTEFEPDVSSFCPGQSKLYLFNIIFNTTLCSSNIILRKSKPSSGQQTHSNSNFVQFLKKNKKTFLF